MSNTMSINGTVTIKFPLRNVISPEELRDFWGEGKGLTFEQYVRWFISEEGLDNLIDDATGIEVVEVTEE